MERRRFSPGNGPTGETPQPPSFSTVRPPPFPPLAHHHHIAPPPFPPSLAHHHSVFEVCHIQVFALSRWLAVTLPINYYEFVRGLEWSIPYFSLPWDSENSMPVMIGSGSSGFHSHVSKVQDLGTPEDKNLHTDASIYEDFFGSKRKKALKQNSKLIEDSEKESESDNGQDEDGEKRWNDAVCSRDCTSLKL